MASPLIEVRNLAFGYSGESFLRVERFGVDPGEIVGVIGPNGAGKSTLLRIMGGVLSPDSGEVRFDGKCLGELGRREIGRRIAAMPQDTVIEFPFSVTEIVLMGRAPYSSGFGFECEADLTAAHEAMRLAGVDHLASREVHELSGGERQRVVLARVLAQAADALLLDEPTAYLDLKHETAIFALLRRIAGEGKAIVVVLHDLNLAAACCDRLILLADGVVRAIGRPQEVLTPETIRSVYGIAATVEVDAAGNVRIAREWPRAATSAGSGRPAQRIGEE